MMESANLLDEIIADKGFFTLNAYKKVSKIANSNFVMSPFSVENILTLACLGAKGETAEEIRVALAYLLCSQEKIESAIKAVISSLTTEDYYTLKIANKIYVKKDFEINIDFKKMAIDVFKADLENIDFNKSDEAARIINEWVEDRTENKIHDLINPEKLTQFTRIILINALYFKAEWVKPFKHSLTAEKDFYKKSNEIVKVQTMQSSSHYNYYEYRELKATFLEIRLKDEASMVLVLPDEKNGLGDIENRIDLVITEPEFTREYVTVELPKFKIETTLDFKDILAKSGIVKAFEEKEADFSRMAGDVGDLYIESIIHKAFMDVGEEGIEAAAATSAEMCVPRMAFISPGPPREFIVDHPFIFYIKIKGLIIFVGRVLDPTKS